VVDTDTFLTTRSFFGMRVYAMHEICQYSNDTPRRMPCNLLAQRGNVSPESFTL
jgi:hypothetical protein